MTASPSEPQRHDQVGAGDVLADGPEGDVPMSFWDHLAELRVRLMRAALGLLVGVVIGFWFVRELQSFLKAPLDRAWEQAGLPGRPALQALAVMDVFMTDVRVAVTAGIFVAAPVIFYQLWMFISPGLYSHEKKYVIPFVATSALMFTAGAAFCYAFVLPFSLEWLLAYPAMQGSEQVDVVYQITVNSYVKDATKLLLAFGLVFEFPLAVFFLTVTGAITHRSLLRFWKLAVVIIFIVAGLLTPPEPVSQLMMAVPMVLLFFGSVGVAYVFSKPARVPDMTDETSNLAASP